MNFTDAQSQVIPQLRKTYHSHKLYRQGIPPKESPGNLWHWFKNPSPSMPGWAPCARSQGGPEMSVQKLMAV